MSTSSQRKRLKSYFRQCDAIRDAWEQGNDRMPPRYPAFPDDLRGLQCGAKTTRAGTPCKSTAIYRNGRCLFHGGCSTGPTSLAGKARAAMNGHCPKKKRTHEG
ncbi:HGGxSTG domain-containing protein [Methylomonas rapida]|uniref:HGGxSTG domain-containing protein n=1 Tax=Methylomonas rapida TaxID=2963939 RepID=UPI0038B29278